MAINYPQFRANLTKEDMGVPDYLGSLNKGLNLFQNTQKSAFLPQKLQDEQTSRQQTNQINKPYADNAMRRFESEVGLKEAQTQAALREKPIGGKISQLEQLRDRYSPGSKEYVKYDEALTRALEGSNGITVYDPQGNPMVQIGGGQSKGKGGGGQLYQSPTGAQYQTPTSAILGQMQNRVAGQKLVEPYLNKVIETLPQFQSSWTRLLAKGEGALNRWAGTDFDLPSQLQTGEASLVLAAEGMLRQFGLNATGHNLDRMEKILTPGPDESQEGFKRRALEQAQDFLKSALQAQENARVGIKVKNEDAQEAANGANNQANIAISKNPDQIRAAQQAENPTTKSNEDAFINQMSEQLIKYIPEATPKSIKETRDSRKMTTEQVINALIKKRDRILREKQARGG